jgi:hypothetical protein
MPMTPGNIIRAFGVIYCVAATERFADARVAAGLNMKHIRSNSLRLGDGNCLFATGSFCEEPSDDSAVADARNAQGRHAFA